MHGLDRGAMRLQPCRIDWLDSLYASTTLAHHARTVPCGRESSNDPIHPIGPDLACTFSHSEIFGRIRQVYYRCPGLFVSTSV